MNPTKQPSEATVKSPRFTREGIAAHMQEAGFRPDTPGEPLDVARLEAWASAQGYSWDADSKLPEPECGGCGIPINVWDGEDACPDCDDCETCCWDNHGGEPHAVMARRYETDLPWNRGSRPDDDAPSADVDPCKGGPCVNVLMPGEECEVCGRVAPPDETPPRSLNDYEQRQEDRRARYEQRAAKATAEADAAFGRARRIGDYIPFGQPILVGHHSERRHRRDLQRIDDSMRKGVEAVERAQHYERKAAGVGRGGISSDDPEAVPKLRAELAELERRHARMKGVSKALQAKDPHAALAELGFTSDQAEKLLAPNYMDRPCGIEPWMLSNSSANIRRVRQRIAHLEAQAARPVPAAREVAGVRIEEDGADKRLRLIFPGKPSEAVRTTLKRWGFRWSPTNGAWQRHRSNAATYAAEQVLAAYQREAVSGGEA